jgi:hypothetical protein
MLARLVLVIGKDHFDADAMTSDRAQDVSSAQKRRPGRAEDIGEHHTQRKGSDKVGNCGLSPSGNDRPCWRFIGLAAFSMWLSVPFCYALLFVNFCGSLEKLTERRRI